MIRLASACLAALVSAGNTRADTPAIPLAAARGHFAEAAQLCAADGGKLWGVPLCGPMMFVEPASRTVVANRPDAEGMLREHDGLYVGQLPAGETIANTAFTWSGVRWIQLAWPLPEDPGVRAVLLMHESFHGAQGSGRLPPAREADNAHLDSLEGRYLLQLEWRALSRALEAGTSSRSRAALHDALLFRARRHALFPGAANAERALELNEGLAEYTGIRLGLAESHVEAAQRSLARHALDPSFVRSFAYATGPAYGLLLDRWSPGWRRASLEGFEQRLASTAGRVEPGATPVDARAADYDGARLRAAEVERDRARRELLARNHARFVDGPVLVLAFRRMKIQFDPRNLVPLPPEGTVYPTLRVTDEWGVLDVTGGALLAADWKAVRVPVPAQDEGATIQGPGWTLELNEGWKLVPGARAGDLAVAGPN
jgi:hypothetical protein